MLKAKISFHFFHHLYLIARIVEIFFHPAFFFAMTDTWSDSIYVLDRTLHISYVIQTHDLLLYKTRQLASNNDTESYWILLQHTYLILLQRTETFAIYKIYSIKSRIFIMYNKY
jgi:hypothetical protein